MFPFNHNTVSLSNRDFLSSTVHQCYGFEQAGGKYDELKGSQLFGMPQTESNKFPSARPKFQASSSLLLSSVFLSEL